MLKYIDYFYWSRKGIFFYLFQRSNGGALATIVGVPVHVQNLFPIHGHDPGQNAFLCKHNTIKFFIIIFFLNERKEKKRKLMCISKWPDFTTEAAGWRSLPGGRRHCTHGGQKGKLEERRHVARMREEVVSEFNTVILLILATSNSNGDSSEHNSSVSLTLRRSRPERNTTPIASNTNTVTLTLRRKKKIHIKNHITRTLCISLKLFLMTPGFLLFIFILLL